MRNLHIRGDWTPARLSYADLWALVTVLVAQAVLRATDYASGTNVDSLTTIERAFPLWAWATALYVGASLLIVGCLARRHFAVWLGHGVLWVTYLAIFVGLAVSVAHQPYFDGLRFAGALLATTVLHFLLWLRTGPRPLKECDSETVETIAGPGTAS